MKGIKSLVVVCACLISSCAFAAIAKTGWYLEGNLGDSKNSGKTYPGKVYATGFGWNATAGYRFTEFVSVDVGYTGYRQTRIKTPSGTRVAFTDQYSYDLAGKITLPILKSGWEIFGRGGVGRLNTYTHVTNSTAANANGYVFNAGVHTQTVPYYGGGVQYGILTNLLVNGQWMRAQGTNATGIHDLYSIGLAYIF